jgi:hypothetical protein
MLYSTLSSTTSQASTISQPLSDVLSVGGGGLKYVTIARCAFDRPRTIMIIFFVDTADGLKDLHSSIVCHLYDRRREAIRRAQNTSTVLVNASEACGPESCPTFQPHNASTRVCFSSTFLRFSYATTDHSRHHGIVHICLQYLLHNDSQAIIIMKNKFASPGGSEMARRHCGS